MNAETKVERDTLSIWNRVSRTDPKHTKKVNQRGGFTAISAHYQVMSATAEFGPVGIGWGYSNGEPIFHDSLVIVPVTLWHGDRTNTFGPIFGGAEWKTGTRLDSDALKKAATDGLTKGLSHLGFNADVFLGLFDDNKYVEHVRQEIEKEEREEGATKVPGISGIKKRLNAMMLTGNALTDIHAFNALVTANKADLTAIKDANHDYWVGDGGDEHEGFKKWIVRRRAELTPPEASELYRDLVDSLNQCDTKEALNALVRARGDSIGDLDGEESRTFERQFEERMEAAKSGKLVLVPAQ